MPEVPNPETMKEQALFYFDRYLAKLEKEVPDQQKMAEQGLSYSERIAATKHSDAEKKDVELELGAMLWLREKLMGL